MSDFDRDDFGTVLRSAERPRELTDDEIGRILVRVDIADGVPELVELDRARVERTGRRSFGGRLAVIAASVAAVTMLFVMFSVRRAAAPEPAVPLTVAPPVIESASFCTDRIEPITSALVRWRGVENWAWADGDPDVGLLVDQALTDAVDDASAARDRLREQLDAADDPVLDQRTAAAARVAAVDSALDVLVSLTAANVPSCDATAIDEAR